MRTPVVRGRSLVRPSTIGEWFGAVLMGAWPDRRQPHSRMAHWFSRVHARSLTAMAFSPPPQSPARFGTVVGGTLLGTCLVVVGLLLAYLAIATPMVSSLAPTRPGSAGISIGLGVWSFALIAGGSLLVAGTNRLALALVTVRRGRPAGGPAGLALASSSGEIAVAAGVVPGDGAPIPELAVGPFGAAVIHALPASNRVRHGASGWERRTSDGWQPMDDPLDVAMRDAERVRRWLAGADLDFVIRVYAALVVDDRALQRSPTCAVISNDQISAWIASLPLQRTLTAGRRSRLLAMMATASRPSGRHGASW